MDRFSLPTYSKCLEAWIYFSVAVRIFAFESNDNFILLHRVIMLFITKTTSMYCKIHRTLLLLFSPGCQDTIATTTSDWVRARVLITSRRKVTFFLRKIKKDLHSQIITPKIAALIISLGIYL